MSDNMETGRNLKALLYLDLVAGMGNASVVRDFVPLMRRMGIDDIGRDDIFSLVSRLGFENDKNAWEEAEYRYGEVIGGSGGSKSDIAVVTCFDGIYPKRLMRFIDMERAGKRPPYHPPAILYCRGDISLLDLPSIAVVGTRNPSADSISAEKWLVRSLIADARVIVSGMASGCDTVAHRTALETAGRIKSLCESGKTIAVLPGGLNNIYPKGNAGMAEEMVSSGRGLLLSAYRPDESAYRYRFVERDSLIAALSGGVFAVQCGQRSGTMHAVKAAENMGRPLACWWKEAAAEDMEGDFLGNYQMVSKMDAIPVCDERTLRDYLDLIDSGQRNFEKADQVQEQLSFI